MTLGPSRAAESSAPQPQAPIRSERPGRPEKSDAASINEAPAPTAK